ncbi:hypothetical protein diail_1020 [Diaporthe ilicicola]|nr:hypothetical protein diail_1020 [Diaporthe ilicicola]
MAANPPNIEIGSMLNNICEKIQVTCFSLQELVLSGFYICSMIDFFRLQALYTNNHFLQTAFKPFVYSVKLMLEFGTLNALVNSSTNGNHLTLRQHISSQTPSHETRSNGRVSPWSWNG